MQSHYGKSHNSALVAWVAREATGFRYIFMVFRESMRFSFKTERIGGITF